MHTTRAARASAAPRLDLLPTAEDLAFATMVTRGTDMLSRVAVVRAEPLDRRAHDSGDVRIWLALECLQVTGSFKVRGALTALAKMQGRGLRRVVAASAGNHGAGVARVAPRMGIEATIVVPRGAPRKKVDAIRAAGATVIEHGEGYDAAEAHAIALADERGDPFVSPYDDVDVIAGNGGTLAAEIADVIEPDLLLAPFGGGGLATGLACGLAHHAGEPLPLSLRRVWGVQGERSPAFALSLERGAAVTSLQAAETLADGLEGALPERAFARAAGVVAGVLVVTEDAIAGAMRAAFRELGLVLEGSAAAALAPVLAGLPPDLVEASLAEEGHADVVVVLTGRNVDPERLMRLVC